MCLILKCGTEGKTYGEEPKITKKSANNGGLKTLDAANHGFELSEQSVFPKYGKKREGKRERAEANSEEDEGREFSRTNARRQFTGIQKANCVPSRVYKKTRPIPRRKSKSARKASLRMESQLLRPRAWNSGPRGAPHARL